MPKTIARISIAGAPRPLNAVRPVAAVLFVIGAGFVATACSTESHDAADRPAGSEHSASAEEGASQRDDDGVGSGGEHARSEEGGEHSASGGNSGHGRSDVREHHRSERGGEHGEGEGHDEEGEESGVYIERADRWADTRRGVRLVLAFDAATNAFTGTVENTTGEKRCAVRVEVHLSNGTELGPTPRADLDAGATMALDLAIDGERFERWTAHPEVSDCRHG